MARPEMKIDLAELEKLCGMQCTDEEVAAFFGVSTRTIERRRGTKAVGEVMDRAKAKGRVFGPPECVSARRRWQHRGRHFSCQKRTRISGRGQQRTRRSRRRVDPHHCQARFRATKR